MGFDALVLTTVGARSGAERTSPVGAAHPDQVQIEVDGRKLAVTAEQLHGAEREEAWQRVITASPRFAQYQEQTDRELPVIRLVPRAG